MKKDKSGRGVYNHCVVCGGHALDHESSNSGIVWCVVGVDTEDVWGEKPNERGKRKRKA